MADVNAQPCHGSNETAFIDRREEIDFLAAKLKAVADGRGQFVILEGEAGIGKTRLTLELEKIALQRGFKVMRGNCVPNCLIPLHPIMEALRSSNLGHIILGEKPPRVLFLYLMTDTGILISHYGRTKEMVDSDIFACMLTAVENFVHDCLKTLETSTESGLQSVAYDKYRFVMERDRGINLVAIIEGKENELLRHDMRRVLFKIHKEFGDVLRSWDGNTEKTAPLQPIIAQIIESKKYEGIDYAAMEPRLRQENMFDSILFGLQRESTYVPLLLIIDDLQWADPTTLSLLHYLARNTKGHRIFIIGTYRPEDVVERNGKKHPLADFLRVLSRENLCVSLPLSRLPEIEGLVSSLLGMHRLPRQFMANLYKETAGNPFFVIELVRLLQNEGHIVRSSDGYWELQKPIGEIHIPSRIYDVISRRLARISQEQREILECASVVGEEFSSDILVAMLSMDKIKLLRRLAELERTHNLITSKGKVYRFDHAKIREVLYRDMPEELRQEYHRLVAECYEKIYSKNIVEVVDKLAYHYFEASDQRAIAYAIMAGDNSKKQFANLEALRQYMLALNLMDEKDERKKYVLQRMGEVYTLIGEFEDAISNFEAAMMYAENSEEKARIYREIGTVWAKRGEAKRAVECFNKGLALLGERKCVERARLLTNLSYAYLQMGKYTEGKKAAETSVKLLAELRAESLEIARANRYLASNLCFLGEIERAINIYREQLRAVEGMDLILDSALYNNLGAAYESLGELRQAYECIMKSLEIDQRIGDKRGAMVSSANLGWLLLQMGRLASAEENLLQAYQICEMMGEKYSLAYIFAYLTELYINMADWEKAEKYLELGMELSRLVKCQETLAINLRHKSVLEANRGDLEMAEAMARKAIEVAKASGNAVESGRALRTLAICLRRQLRHAEARTCLKKALEVQGGQKLEIARTLKEIGLLELGLGRVGRGVAHIKKAIAQFEKSGALRDLAEAQKALITYEKGAVGQRRP